MPNLSARRPLRATAAAVFQKTAPGKIAGGGHVVNFDASAADFHAVVQRLARAHNPQPATAGAAPPPQPAAAPKAASGWGSLLGGLLGGGGSQAEASVDPSAPLTRALVMFSATWCGPCAVMSKEMAHAAGLLGGRAPVALLVVSVEEHPELATQLGIKALPTLLFMGPDAGRGPIFTQGIVSSAFILDTLDRAVGYGGHDTTAKWLKL